MVPLNRIVAEAIDAARKFMPIRTIGWDVAVTPDGPVIIEDNLWWAPSHSNALRLTGRFLDYSNRMSGKAGKGRLPDQYRP